MLSPQKSLYTISGWLLVAESLLIFIPLSVLGSAINWPKSLSDPAAKILPLLVENASAVRFGYLVYLVYSILFWVIASLTIRVLSDEESDSIWLRVANGFGIASAVARCLGIIRWLVAMPALAKLYSDSSISTATRESIAVVYHTLNDYAGSVGEVLGVSLFAGLWLAIVSLRILQSELPALNWSTSMRGASQFKGNRRYSSGLTSILFWSYIASKGSNAGSQRLLGSFAWTGFPSAKTPQYP